MFGFFKKRNKKKIFGEIKEGLNDAIGFQSADEELEEFLDGGGMYADECDDDEGEDE